MEVNKYKLKFKLLFDKFFLENFELSSYYSENLLKFLEYCPDKSAESILETPFFSDLIMYSLRNLENATTSVKIFIMEIITIVVKNELQFSKLCQMHGFIMMGEKLCALHTTVPPMALHITAIKVATAQTAHYSGITWLVQNKVWKYILSPKIHRRSHKVTRAAYDFISKLVWKLDEYGEEVALIEILQFVVQPLKASGYSNIQVISTEQEKDLLEPLIPYLHALFAIMSKADKRNASYKVVELLTKYFIVEVDLHFILIATRDFDITSLICQMTSRFLYAICKEAISRNIRSESEVVNEIISHYYNVVLLLLQKRKTAPTIDFILKTIIFWAKTDNSVISPTFERHGRTFDVRNQFVMLVITPLLSYAYNIHNARGNHAMIEALDVYIMKLTNITTEHIVKAGYSFRTVIEGYNPQKVVINMLRELFALKGLLNVAQAGILYQALYYTLHIYVISDGSGDLIVNENPVKSPDDLKVLSLVLEAIKMLLKEHDINWYENVEIICLQSNLMNLLKQNFMPTKQLLQAVDLIDLSVQKFLSPDMALLMESKQGSTLNEIGAIMKSYIQHEEWEVRDSTLHLLLSCTEVAFIKYIPLQKLLTENNLILLATHAALSDDEFYVQTTALRCLAAATKIESIWRHVLNAHPTLYMQLIYIMKNNPEGIVRKEAASVLTELHVNQKLSKNFVKCLHEAMINAALNDLHWEVQVAALNFWKNAIHSQMSNRGMVDGKFPSVTFSKEKRKIINLNENEIHKQLAGIMNDLSSIGCLNVLYKCLNDEFNIEVMEQAYNVAKELIDVLDRYKYELLPDVTATSREDMNNLEMNCDDSQYEYITPNIDEAMDLSCVPPRNQTNLRDQVIESIVNTNHEDLLNELYDNYVQIKPEEMDEDDTTIPITEYIEPNRFLRRFKETDYLSMIEIKKKWNSGPSNLDSLLDEALQLGENKKKFEDDCSD